VLKRRVERLPATSLSPRITSPRQAFGRAYACAEAPSLPPYLQREHFADVRERAGG